VAFLAFLKMHAPQVGAKQNLSELMQVSHRDQQYWQQAKTIRGPCAKIRRACFAQRRIDAWA
jgi:hypothetical protein